MPLIFPPRGLLLANLTGDTRIDTMPTTPHPDILATAVLIADAQQRVTRYINPAAENLLGISAYHALERPVGNVARANALNWCAHWIMHYPRAPVTPNMIVALAINGHTLVLSATVSPH
jgi:nitrogen-specific signal transduction histidine kinase